MRDASIKNLTTQKPSISRLSKLDPQAHGALGQCSTSAQSTDESHDSILIELQR